MWHKLDNCPILATTQLAYPSLGTCKYWQFWHSHAAWLNFFQPRVKLHFTLPLWSTASWSPLKTVIERDVFLKYWHSHPPSPIPNKRYLLHGANSVGGEIFKEPRNVCQNNISSFYCTRWNSLLPVELRWPWKKVQFVWISPTMYSCFPLSILLIHYQTCCYPMASQESVP